jgi:hypothetical protein
MKTTCKDCRWIHHDKCRRFPPAFSPVGAQFPQVDALRHWCGEFAPEVVVKKKATKKKAVRYAGG